MDTQKYYIQNLGHKHRYHNEVVEKAIANNTTEIHVENENVKILAQIDIASHKRDLKYILQILKSDDLLYTSRAIKKCNWLIMDNSYAHIIDPGYLNEHLYPNMTVKAKNKLHKHIRNIIKDEQRAEKFYIAEDTVDAALKWLPKCSIPFIENKVIEHFSKINKGRLFKRLCERSINILNLIDDSGLSTEKMKAAKFVQKKDCITFLNAIARMSYYETLKLNKKTTKLLMGHCSNQIIENFNKYCNNLHIETFAECLKPENIKEFIYKQVGLVHTSDMGYEFDFEQFQHFIQRIPKEERFDFIKKVFIDQVHKHQDCSPGSEIDKMKTLFNIFRCPKYVWYKFAPFDVAFSEIEHYSNPEKRNFLRYLINIFHANELHLQTLLKYFHDNFNIHDNFDIIDHLLSESKFYYYNDTTWNILTDAIKSHDCSELNKKSSDYNKFNEIIIIRNIVKNEPIEEQLQKKFVFSDTLGKYRNKLKPEEQFRMFHLIFNHVLKKIKGHVIENEEQFDCVVKLLHLALRILRDWGKDLIDYPVVLKKIKDTVQIKTEQSWKNDLSILYNVKKSWKQLMFGESLLLELSENVCINALKHNPGLLELYKQEVKYLLNDCKLYLRGFLRKIRIYFSESLSKEYTNHILLRLEQRTDYNIAIRNLCTLMEHEDISNVIRKYVPKKARINWDEENGLMLNVRRYIAKNMHFSSPQPPPDAILSYAKGDYLQYAVPSIMAIFYNLKSSVFREFFPKFMNSPVSLQKLGIRLAISKLNHDELVKEFHKLLTTTKNISIRSIVFQLTFKLLCKQKDNRKIRELWNLLKLFIDNLTFKEDKIIYTLLGKTSDVPNLVKADFIERNYIFLESYLAQADNDINEFERMRDKLILDSVYVIENMNDDFIIRVLKKIIDSKVFCEAINPCNGILSLISIYLLSCKDERRQENKYKSILLPILHRVLGKLKEENRWMENMILLLDYLRSNLNAYAIEKNMVIPVKMFSDINKELIKTLNVPKFYAFLTKWQLTVEYLKHLHKTPSVEDKDTGKLSLDTEQFGHKCLAILKEHVEKHFPRIYLIFYKVLFEMLKDVCSEHERIEVYLHMLSDKDFIQSYLTVISLAALCYYKNRKWDEIREILKSHPSKEVKMHYYYHFNKFRREYQ